jgi:hypothetical protein
MCVHKALKYIEKDQKVLRTFRKGLFQNNMNVVLKGIIPCHT